MKTADYQAADAAHYLHPFTDSRELADNARVITRAEGVYLWDSDGNKILDGMSGLWCVNLGYGRQDLIAAATAQMQELPYYNSFFQCATPPAITLAKRLAQIAPPGFNRVFYAGSGSEANDTVVRLLRYYWQLRDQPQRRILIARHNAYHGSTVAAASLGGMPAMHAQGGLPIPDIVHIPQPYWYGEGQGQTPHAFGQAAADALEDAITKVGSERVAGFIGEPVQGAGGVIIPPDGYWARIQSICDAHDIPIIADEVICGFGRLGQWFGHQHFGFTPKIISCAKGLTSGYLPMGAVVLHDSIADVLAARGGELAHGYTYSGHPTCAAVANATIDAMQNEDIVARVREDTAPYLQQCWAQLGTHELVGEARGVGMLGALELKSAKDTDRPAGALGVICRQHSLAAGLVMRATRDTMLISPPLTITHSKIDALIAAAHTALTNTLHHT